MKIQSVVIVVLSVSQLSFTLFSVWLSLGWRVRRTRRAFEKQLILQGMSKRNAQRLSAQYAKLKDEMMSTLKGSVFRNR